MRRSTKFFILATLGIGSFTLSSLAVHAVRARTPGPTQQTGPVAGEGPARPGLAPPDPNLVAKLSLHMDSVDVAEGVVHVAASAIIRESDPTLDYVWSARIVNADDDLLVDQLYDHQSFRVAPGEPFTPTFEDSYPLDLPEGKYKVEVRLHRLPPGVAAADLRDPRIARGLRGSRVSRTFKVGE